ncbi:MAG: hypothetical protein HY329_02395 [Chloroflexi bacterium]|nr:hypothetical protein [Chloroflexota bacterium]
MELRSEPVEVPDYHAAVEEFFERGWTDGLPVVPPTDELIAATIAASGRAPQEELGDVPPRHGVATVETVAINAVMAGCKPEYFPVVLAAVEALLDPHHNLNGVNTTTHNCQPLIVVSGPIARAIGMNSAEGVFGAGYRANGTIGRAISLIRWNLGGSVPGQVDRSTLSHPGRWSYCIAESDESPWQPFHADRGLPPEVSGVTVFSGEAPHSVLAYGEPEEVVHALGASMATPGSNNASGLGETLVVINPYIAQRFAAAGWSKDDIKEAIWKKAHQPAGQIRKSGALTRDVVRRHWPDWMKALDDDELAPLVERPDQIHVVIAGGKTYFSAWVPGWGYLGGMAVTRPVAAVQV